MRFSRRVGGGLSERELGPGALGSSGEHNKMSTWTHDGDPILVKIESQLKTRKKLTVDGGGSVIHFHLLCSDVSCCSALRKRLSGLKRGPRPLLSLPGRWAQMRLEERAGLPAGQAASIPLTSPLPALSETWQGEEGGRPCRRPCRIRELAGHPLAG